MCVSDSIMLLAPFIHSALGFFFCFFFFLFSVSVSQAPLLGIGNAQVNKPKQVLDPALTQRHRMQATAIKQSLQCAEKSAKVVEPPGGAPI